MKHLIFAFIVLAPVATHAADSCNPGYKIRYSEDYRYQSVMGESVTRTRETNSKASIQTLLADAKKLYGGKTVFSRDRSADGLINLLSPAEQRFLSKAMNEETPCKASIAIDFKKMPGQKDLPRLFTSCNETISFNCSRSKGVCTISSDVVECKNKDNLYEDIKMAAEGDNIELQKFGNDYFLNHIVMGKKPLPPLLKVRVQKKSLEIYEGTRKTFAKIKQVLPDTPYEIWSYDDDRSFDDEHTKSD